MDDGKEFQAFFFCPGGDCGLFSLPKLPLFHNSALFFTRLPCAMSTGLLCLNQPSPPTTHSLSPPPLPPPPPPITPPPSSLPLLLPTRHSPAPPRTAFPPKPPTFFLHPLRSPLPPPSHHVTPTPSPPLLSSPYPLPASTSRYLDLGRTCFLTYLWTMNPFFPR